MNIQINIGGGGGGWGMQGLLLCATLNILRLHIVVTIAQNACDRVLKRVLKSVNISIANISCEILIPAIITTVKTKAYVES